MKHSIKEVKKHEYTLILSAGELKALNDLIWITDMSNMNSDEKAVAEDIYKVFQEYKDILSQEVLI
ncbi:hypothetical protein LCGC14_2670040 [marine sediment metagenome]|uniref:Uncharacterized protein n=1 Tax=marine sediment metagenome TaxID=412755 RepID=A0A0F8ZPD6_9ZZZZ